MKKLFSSHKKTLNHFLQNEKLSIAFIVFLLFNFGTSLAQCPYNIIRFTSQASIDSFSINYPNCDELKANIHIGPSIDIINFNSLTNVKIRSPYVSIKKNEKLSSLNSLSNMDSISVLEIRNNPKLEDVSIFEDIKIHSRGGSPVINISNNPLLKNCCFTANLNNICASLTIENNGQECNNAEQVINNCTPQNNYSCVNHHQYSSNALSANNVKTGIKSNGALFYRENYSYFGGSSIRSFYEVPAGSRIHSLRTANLWMGGIDENGDVRIAAQNFTLNGEDFLPGPIVENYDDCRGFDKVWHVSKASIDTFLNQYIKNDGNINIDSIPETVLKYPAKNNPHFDEFSLPENTSLAPFIDTNNDGKYNPVDGDYPAVKGDENTWNIFNDIKYSSRALGCNQPLKMQIACMAFASASDDYIDNATFYDYTLSYFGNETIKDFYFGIYVNPDLGDPKDDFVGCSINERLGYAYNGDDDDFQHFGGFYGRELPTVGIKFIKSLLDENSNQSNLASFVVFEDNFGVRGNPNGPINTYNYLKGSNWKDGIPITFGRNGYGGDTPNPYMYSDPPNAENGWSEFTEGNQPGDRRFVMSVGPITLSPGEVQTVTIGILWYPNVGGGNPDLSPLFESSKQIETDIDSVFALTCNGNIIWYEDLDGDGLGDAEVTKYACKQPIGFVAEKDSSQLTNIETTFAGKLNITPNPASQFINISFNSQSIQFYNIKIYSSSGQLIYHTKTTNNKNQNRIDISDYENGIYFIEITDDSKNIAQASFIVH